MSDGWQIMPLLKHLQETRRHELWNVLDSLGRYLEIFRFNAYAARDAMKGVVDEQAPGSPRDIAFLFGASERQEEFERARLAIDAHVLGAVQAARSMHDVFAFLVNGLVLSPPLSERDCSFSSVLKRLPASKLKRAMEATSKARPYKYVEAFFNVAKHRYLVQHSYSVSLTDEPSTTYIQGFNYGGEDWPRLSLHEFLVDVMEVQNAIIPSGIALNEQVLGGNT